MNSFKFTKIDLISSKSQLKVLLIFVIFAIIFAQQNQSTGWIVGYLSFGVLIMSVTPFTIESSSQNTFIHLLPASVTSRVAGRFLYFMLTLIAVEVIAVAITLVTNAAAFSDGFQYFFLLVISACILVGSLQYAMFYALGQMKNAQAMIIIRMVPSFVFFFLAMTFSEFIQKESGSVLTIVTWISEHMPLVSAAAFIASLLIFILCISFSAFICRRKKLN